MDSHELTKLFHRERKVAQPVNANDAHQQALSRQDQVALWITAAIGTMYAVYFFAIFMGIWMIWQSIVSHAAFDPYPFAFLLFLGNIVQLLLMPLIMVGQNIQGRHAELRAEEQYKATVNSLSDAEHIIEHLNALDKELVAHREMLAKLLGNQSS